MAAHALRRQAKNIKSIADVVVGVPCLRRIWHALSPARALVRDDFRLPSKLRYSSSLDTHVATGVAKGGNGRRTMHYSNDENVLS